LTRQAIAEVIPGLLLCVLLALISILVADNEWFKERLHLSPLLIVILLGMAVRSSVPLGEVFTAGLRLAQRPLLRIAVAGLGFRLSLQQLAAIGAPALVVVSFSTVVALWFGWWIGKRLGVPHHLNLLLGVGGAICGASAVVAADSVVQAERRDAAVALGTITLLGTIGIVLYPAIGHLLGMSSFLYGVWNGASLHEMAQVVAAGHGFRADAVEVSTVAKLARITLLAPVVFYLAWSIRKAGEAGKAKVQALPGFLVAFVLIAALNSTGWLPENVVKDLQRADLWLLTVGMAGVGLQTHLTELKQAGAKPFFAGLLQWVFLAAVSLGLARVLCGP
jgi:uncharacterized integral membrane protein (TIGR00698 family)